MRVYRDVISRQSHIDISEVSAIVADSPCSRFWVSEERTMVVVSALDAGRPILDTMRPLKREMFQLIYDRVCIERSQNPTEPLFDIVMRVVNSPAPKFYLQPRCAMDIIYKIKNGYYEQRKRRF